LLRHGGVANPNDVRRLLLRSLSSSAQLLHAQTRYRPLVTKTYELYGSADRSRPETPEEAANWRVGLRGASRRLVKMGYDAALYERPGAWTQSVRPDEALIGDRHCDWSGSTPWTLLDIRRPLRRVDCVISHAT
jgi:hypothetical protein